MSLLDQLPHLCSIGREVRTNDGLGGNVYGIVVERQNIECWQQQASASEIKDFAKRGIAISTKVYFTENPLLTERHRLVITYRMGVYQPNTDMTEVGNPNVLDVVSTTFPDASAGLGILWKIFCSRKTSATQ